MTDTTIKKLVTYEDSVSHEQKILTDNGVPVTTNINLEEASVQIANATTEITPSSQYDGLSKVTATIPIRTNLSGAGVNDTITIPNISTTGITLNQNSGNGILNIATQATPVFKAQDFVVYNNLSGMNGTPKSQTLNVNLQDYLIDNTNKPITQNGSNINVTNYKTIKVQVEGTGSDVSGVTATAPDVANSKVFVNSDGQNVTGSMNLTDLTITPSNTQQTWDNYNAQGNYTCYKKIICKPQASTNIKCSSVDNRTRTSVSQLNIGINSALASNYNTIYGIFVFGYSATNLDSSLTQYNFITGLRFWRNTGIINSNTSQYIFYQRKSWSGTSFAETSSTSVLSGISMTNGDYTSMILTINDNTYRFLPYYTIYYIYN